MTKPTRLTIIFCMSILSAYSQNDTATSYSRSEIFEKISKSLKEFKPDTASPPHDKITRKIIELRKLRGVFNINEAIDFKIEEDRQKNEVPKSELDKLSIFFKSGEGKKWLENAVIWIYRQHFSYKELNRMVKFYKTSAGQKTATNFPFIMMQSLRATEIIKELYTAQQNNKGK